MKRQVQALAGRWLLVAAGVAAVWMTTEDRLPGPPIRHPGRMAAWWQSQGAIVAVFSTGRCALLLAGCYWLALLTLAMAGAAGGPGLRALHQLSRCRLPGARLAVTWTAGLSAAGSIVLTAGVAGAATAAPAVAAPVVPPPQLVNLSPAGGGAGSPSSTASPTDPPGGAAAGGGAGSPSSTASPTDPVAGAGAGGTGTAGQGQASAGNNQPPILRYVGPSGTETPHEAPPSPAVGSSPEATAEPATSPNTPAEAAGAAPSRPNPASAASAQPPTVATPPATRPTHPVQPAPFPPSRKRAPAARPTALPPRTRQPSSAAPSRPNPASANSAPASPEPANSAPAGPAPTTPTPAGPANPGPANPSPRSARIDRPPPRHRAAAILRHVPTDDRPRPQPAPQWTVRPGDDFWSISESTLSAWWGRPPTDREIGPYWLAVIAANQDRLPDPGNPNLLFPGDVIVLPNPPQPALHDTL